MPAKRQINLLMKKSYRTPVIVYYLLALAISGPFFYWRTILHWKGFNAPDYLKTLSYMWGPGIAGLICYLLYRQRFKKEITIWGSSLKVLSSGLYPFFSARCLRQRDQGHVVEVSVAL